MIVPILFTLVLGFFKIVSAEVEDNGPVVQLTKNNFDQVYYYCLTNVADDS